MNGRSSACAMPRRVRATLVLAAETARLPGPTIQFRKENRATRRLRGRAGAVALGTRVLLRTPPVPARAHRTAPLPSRPSRPPRWAKPPPPRQCLLRTSPRGLQPGVREGRTGAGRQRGREKGGSANGAGRRARARAPAQYIPMSGAGIAGFLSSGASTTTASLVVMRLLTDAASTSAVRTTLSGSMMPALTMSVNTSPAAS